jgi:hypothetical protein
LTRLCHAIAFGCKPSLRIEFHHFFGFFENAQEEKETANDSARPPLAVIAVKDCYPLDISREIIGDLLAYYKQYIERRRLVILPLKVNHIFQFPLLDAPSADIHSDIFVLVGVLQELADRVY